jgi:putative N6-adenine-specific DNA methylase
VLNPPYGKRLDFDAPKLYTKIEKKLTELANGLAAFNKRLTVAILAPKDDTREGGKYTCTTNLLRECPAISPEHNPAVKIIETSHGGISLNAIIATV